MSRWTVCQGLHPGAPVASGNFAKAISACDALGTTTLAALVFQGRTLLAYFRPLEPNFCLVREKESDHCGALKMTSRRDPDELLLDPQPRITNKNGNETIMPYTVNEEPTWLAEASQIDRMRLKYEVRLPVAFFGFVSLSTGFYSSLSTFYLAF